MAIDDDDKKPGILPEDELFLRAMKDPDVLESSQSSSGTSKPPKDYLEKSDELFLKAMMNPELAGVEEPLEREMSSPQESVHAVGPTLPLEEKGITDEEANLFKDSIDEWIGGIQPKDEDLESPAPRPGVTAKWKAIKTGKVRPDITLDLHHQSEEQAETSFHGLMHTRRTVPEVALVIVGKGLHSKGKAILRTAIPRWLAAEYSAKVTKWEWAPRHLGGGGAVLILLNRDKEE